MARRVGIRKTNVCINADSRKHISIFTQWIGYWIYTWSPSIHSDLPIIRWGWQVCDRFSLITGLNLNINLNISILLRDAVWQLESRAWATRVRKMQRIKWLVAINHTCQGRVKMICWIWQNKELLVPLKNRTSNSSGTTDYVCSSQSATGKGYQMEK